MTSYDETVRRTTKRERAGQAQEEARAEGETTKRHRECKEEGVIPGGGAAGMRRVAGTRKAPKIGRQLARWIGRGQAQEGAYSGRGRGEGGGDEGRKEGGQVEKRRREAEEDDDSVEEWEEVKDEGERYRRRRRRRQGGR